MRWLKRRTPRPARRTLLEKKHGVRCAKVLNACCTLLGQVKPDQIDIQTCSFVEGQNDHFAQGRS